MITNLREKNGYKLKDYIVVKWAKNREIIGIILGFGDDDRVWVELVITDKKSDVVQRDKRWINFEDIKGRPGLQYGIGEDEEDDSMDEVPKLDDDDDYLDDEE